MSATLERWAQNLDEWDWTLLAAVENAAWENAEDPGEDDWREDGWATARDVAEWLGLADGHRTKNGLRRLVELGLGEVRTVGRGAYVRAAYGLTEEAANLLRARESEADGRPVDDKPAGEAPAP